MKKLRKALVISVMAITVLSLSVLSVPLQVDAAAQAGDLIKMDGLSSVYYLAADGKRYVFPNEATYFSWYGDFSGVVVIPQSELESYSLGANVTIRPGTKLIKITTDPKVYAVEPNGNLVHVPDEATAITLYGADWAGRVVDIADAFFTNYNVTGNQVSDTAYPTGSLVQFGGSADVSYIDATGNARKVADEASFLANRFKWADIIVSTLTAPTAGTDVTGSEEGLTDTSSGAGGTAGAGTGLTVALSADTPVAGNVPGSSAIDFVKINLTAASDGDVSVNSLKMRAFDLGDPSNITLVTILDNGVKQGSSKSINSDKEATFNFSSPILVAAGTTKTLVVRATINATTGNYSLGINTASDIGTNGAVVSGSFPLIGNTKSAVSGASSVATVAMAGITDDSGATAEFGEDNVQLASFTLNVGNEAVLWESAIFKNIGTNDNDIVNNMRIEVDGNVVTEGVGVDNKYATFNMGNMIIAKGDTVTVEVYGDIGVANAANTVHLVVDAASDFSLVGQDTGYGAITSGFDNFNASDEGIKVTLAASDFTIDMDKAATPARDVRRGVDDVVLATIKMTSNGENATVDSISDSGSNDFIVSGTGLGIGEVQNFELYDVDSGSLFDITETWDAINTHWELEMAEEISFVMGVTRTFQLRADLQGPNDSPSLNNNDTLKVTMADGAFTITGDDSSSDLSTTPTSVVSAIATVKDASLTWTTTSLVAKTIVGNASDITIYQASVKAGASSDVTLSSVRIDADDTANFVPFTDDNFASIDLYIDGKLAKSNAKIAGTDGTLTAYVNFTSLNTDAKTITAGDTVTVEVKASFGSDFGSATGTMALELAAVGSVIARDDLSNTFTITAANALTDSRVVTLADNGTLLVDLKVDDQKANNDTYILAGSGTTPDRYIGELVFTTTNEDVKVQTLVLGQAGSATDADILSVQLFDEDDAMVAEEGVDAYGNANFDSFNHIFDADKSTSLFIGVVTKTMNADGDAQGTASYLRTISFNIASSTQLVDELSLTANKGVTAQGVDSGVDLGMTEDTNSALVAGEYATSTSKTTTVTGSVLTSVVNDMTDATLVGGTNKTIAKYKFVFDNGNNRVGNEILKAQLVELKLTIATSSATVTNIEAYLDTDSANKLTATEVSAGIITLNLDEATTGLAEDGLVDGTVELTVIATIAVDGSASNGSVSTEINNLNGDFTYDGNNGTGTDITDPLLDITDVSGGTLTL